MESKAGEGGGVESEAEGGGSKAEGEVGSIVW